MTFVMAVNHLSREGLKNTDLARNRQKTQTHIETDTQADIH